ncbi:uncharacterized protein PpBr36_09402 [Pyricularia pennisetigena]|uniref:uncharacterized protein n=1 Tax=Pyricularia pennisetigena TaxID=1578925 RepID=UPI001154DE05|nr:uncharacterized protein PpBr36_09402 [Pyricularia pennisetigena]TLS22068.1 hypothetical protein PpBr36_09402 [Pyricularia pennisetigena]
MRVAIFLHVILLWAATTTILAQPIKGDNGNSTAGALKLDSEVDGWTREKKPTGTEERPHKCPYDPCDTACEVWAVLISFGLSCLGCQSVHKHCYYWDN